MTRVNNMNTSNNVNDVRYVNNNSEYYYIKSKTLASALAYMTGQTYYILDDKYDSNKKKYSFKDTQKFRNALHLINEFKYNNIDN